MSRPSRCSTAAGSNNPQRRGRKSLGLEGRRKRENERDIVVVVTIPSAWSPYVHGTAVALMNNLHRRGRESVVRRIKGGKGIERDVVIDQIIDAPSMPLSICNDASRYSHMRICAYAYMRKYYNRLLVLLINTTINRKRKI